MNESVKLAVKKFKDIVEEEGVVVDISNVDYDALNRAVQDEYACDFEGSIFDAIMDLNDSVGLDEFGIIITD